MAQPIKSKISQLLYSRFFLLQSYGLNVLRFKVFRCRLTGFHFLFPF